MAYEQLKLENQLCFPVYAASRLIIREYQPLLDKLEITYPQYLVLLVLWEQDGITVNDISHKLILNTNTITPLLKRMENQKLISRLRSNEDERKVIIHLAERGRQIEAEAAKIPLQLANGLMYSSLNVDKLKGLKDKLCELIKYLKEKEGI
jgi:MarR family transcriptional regulator, organic hydroperoxide resistance regulator